VPANRQETLFVMNEVFKNVTLPHLRSICPTLVRHNQEIEITRQQIGDLGIIPPNPSLLVGHLSGGNQQKVVLGKWLTVLPKVLLLNDPTRGMDVGAKREVMEAMEGLREKGVATILFSQEPELLMAYADRVIVLHRGERVTEMPNEELSEEKLLAFS
jgi:ribose transport system ATP-binding protein